MEELSLFDFPELEINKPIRLIELFGGIGSQFMAMKRIGAKVESWLLCEFDPYAVKSFNAIHGTNYKPSDVCELHGKDLKIVEKRQVAIKQYSKNGDFIKTWKSARACQNETGYFESNINKCCNGKIKSYKGYIWKYA